MIDNLTEAITHAKEKASEQRRRFEDIYGQEEQTEAERKEAITCLDCSNEHGQLIAWLEELKARREADRWIPVSEKLPEEKFDYKTQDFSEVLCTTVWDDVRTYKFGQPIGHDKAHFWGCGGIMDEYVTAWKPLPEPYESEGDN